MRRLSLLLAALGLTVASGCQSVVRSYVLIGRAGPATQRAAEIRLASGPLPLGFEEVAVMQVQAHGFDSEPGPGLVRGELAWGAGTLGCNLMIEISLDQGAQTTVGVALAARTSGTRSCERVCSVVSVPPSSTSPASTSPASAPLAGSSSPSAAPATVGSPE